jgi:hypothetical protein
MIAVKKDCGLNNPGIQVVTGFSDGVVDQSLI